MKKLLLLITLLFLAACQQDNEESLLEEKQEESDMKYVTDSDPVEKEEKSNQQAAQHLARIAVEVPDVHDATAVVLGDYVAVGIDVDKDLDRSRVGVVKLSVAEALKHDPYGKQAFVTADADGVERLRGIRDRMAEGHPIQAITDELSQVIGRYMPEGPINDQPDTNSNKNSVPEKEQKELENIEEEQSNHKSNQN